MALSPRRRNAAICFAEAAPTGELVEHRILQAQRPVGFGPQCAICCAFDRRAGGLRGHLTSS